MREVKAKLLLPFFNIENVDMNGKELIGFEHDNNLFFDAGYGCLVTLKNDDTYTYYEIIEYIKTDDESDALRLMCDDLKSKLEQRDTELVFLRAELKNKMAPEIERSKDLSGYCIVALNKLDTELASHVLNVNDSMITGKELVAMHTSALMEINKGDTSKSSLNVKLYNSTKDSADIEIQKLIEGGK